MNQGMRSCVDTLGRSAPAAMGVATCYGQEGQILRLNAKGIVQYKFIIETLVCVEKDPLFSTAFPLLFYVLFYFVRMHNSKQSDMIQSYFFRIFLETKMLKCHYEKI